MATATPMTATTPGAQMFRWILAWGALLTILSFANKTRAGHVAIYYLLLASLLFLLATQYKWLANVLQPITTVTAGG